jgi:hypothetical protein
MIGHARFHRGSNAQRLMDAREVVGIRWSDTAQAWFSTFFEKALVGRVKRRQPMRIVGLARPA